MNRLLILIGLFATLIGCDSDRIYEQNVSFERELWRFDSIRYYEFDIPNSKTTYNILTNIQYTNDFTYRNMYVTYLLLDSTGGELEKKLVNTQLFTDKLGKPVGNSAIGSVYELQEPILSDYEFPYKGKYRLSLQHYMRIDSLYGISGIGIRVEKTSSDKETEKQH